MRNLLPYVILLALLVGLAGFAWLSAHPAHPIVERSMAWPVVGAAARWFRSTYPVASPEAIPLAYDHFAESSPHGVRPEIWVEPGVVLRAQPSEGSTTTGEVRNLTNAALIEQRGAWYLVETARQGKGWAHLPEYQEPDHPIFGSGLLPAGPLQPQPADPERLGLARELLGDAGGDRNIGSYRVLSDLEDARFWARFEESIAHVEARYFERYGVTPIGEARETIVVFAKEADYRRFLDSEEAARSSGHASIGLVAVHGEQRLREEVVTTLVHELAHLLNRRALGPALPLWLEEGIAEDLARQLGRPLVITAENAWWVAGPGAAPFLLREAKSRGQAPSLAQLASGRGDAALMDPETRPLYYSAAGLWVRFLSETEVGVGWRAYLQGIAAGGPVGLESLEGAIGSDAYRLEEAFWPWFESIE